MTSTDRVVARIALPAPGRAVDVSGDGMRGFVAAGSTILVIDVNERSEITRRALGDTGIRGLAVTQDARRLFAVQGGRLRVVRAGSLKLLGSVSLGGGAAARSRSGGADGWLRSCCHAGVSRSSTPPARACCGASGCRARREWQWRRTAARSSRRAARSHRRATS
ncbi:MAG TPA: hypothetical protein VNA28_12490 [Solirubrobacteraceae bacterium]|nr:hypothetical protein [Solirubrobacteraceae bacterium]